MTASICMRTIIAAAVVGILTGCGTVKVRNTDGIKACLMDQAQAEVRAYEIRKQSADVNSSQYEKANRLYNDAIAAANGFLNGIVVHAELKHEIDISEFDYASHPASRALKRFLSETEDMRPGKARMADPETIRMILGFVGQAVAGIWEIHDQRRPAALVQLNRLVEQHRSVPFSLLSDEYMLNRYKMQEPHTPTEESTVPGEM